MPPPLLMSVREASVRYGEKAVFEDLTFNIHDGARIALVGKNGAGKSTLMNIITGALEPDAGERWQQEGLTIGYLRQDISPQEGMTVSDYIFEEIADADRHAHSYKVDIVTDALQLNPQAQMTTLSGGQLRRAGLARCLVEEPDLLLLDEPTNHLDLEIIEWLEGYLKNYRGTLLCISHDRMFLANITSNVFWLDRGTLKVSPKGFKHFDDWSAELLEQEERELRNRRQSVDIEVAWASRGVKARVKRNVRRIEKVKQMRDKLKADEVAYRRATKTIDLKPVQPLETSAKVVAEFHKVYKSFETTGQDVKILDQFSLRIQRGDRIGILGKNGSGKTTFLKMLLKELEPDQGRVKVRKELEFSYFDQKRGDLKPKDSLKKVLSPSGNDYIDVRGKQRHVCSYLKDFMFDPRDADMPVSHLSGGQKNRLLLAKVLANPKNGLILDEPTNDLDMDTLDMLEEVLSNYQGTLLVVSHDRDFLDQTVTKILAFEGDGEVTSLIGGYSDYLEHKKPEAPKSTSSKPQKQKEKPQTETPPPPQSDEKPKRLTYKLEHELSQLPNKITKLEDEIKSLNAQLTDSDFYMRDPDGFHQATKDLQDAEAKLERYETRWLELDAQKHG